MQKNISIVAAVLGLSLSLPAVDFNASVQGDIASLSYWESLGYSSLPGRDDVLKLSGRAVDPAFCASADMSIGSLVITASGSFIDLTTDDGTLRTVTLNSSSTAMEFTKDGASYKMTGGRWYLANKGYVVCGRANTSSQDNHTIEFSGCIITNAGRFYGAHYDRSTEVKLTNGAEIYADNLYPAYGNYASNSLITISGGSKLVSIGRMIQGDGFNETYEEGVSEVGNNRIEVLGVGSLLKLGGTSLYGHRVPHNRIEIRQGAHFESGALQVGSLATGSGFDSAICVSGRGTRADTGGIELGNSALAYGCGLELEDGANWYSSGSLIVGNLSYCNYATFSSATGSCGSVLLGNQSDSSNNVLKVLSGSKLEIRSGNSLKIGVSGCCNRAEIIDGVVSFSGKGGFDVGVNASSTGNVLRISGADTRVSFSNDAFDPFGAGSGNIILMEEGVSIGGQYYFATNSTGNRFIVRNATLASGQHAHLGTQTSLRSQGNSLELFDGAVAELKSLSISARDNTLFVSNSSLSVTSDTGMRIGYMPDSQYVNSVSNSTVHIAGDNASVVSYGTMSLDNFARLHFGIPRKGWKQAPVHVKSLSFSANSILTADCREFCDYTGGTITLVETDEGIDNRRIGMVLAAANAKLSPRAKFYVSGNNLMFRSPRKGTVVVIR